MDKISGNMGMGVTFVVDIPTVGGSSNFRNKFNVSNSFEYHSCLIFVSPNMRLVNLLREQALYIELG